MTSPLPSPLLGWYGDDFTGATDTLSALAYARWRALLFLGVPTPAQLASVGPLDAIGIAGAARSMGAAAMRAELQPAGKFFAEQRVPILHYKVCSTFDSAPATGSIGLAINTLRPYVQQAFVPIIGGQPNIGRYCAFSNLYAAAGKDGTVYRIDRHPTMSRHPVTPMHEGDLRVHLAAQGLPVIGAIHHPCYEGDDAAQDAMLDAELARVAQGSTSDTHPILFDVVQASTLAHVGRILWQRARERRLLAVGGSSVVQALAAYRAQAEPAPAFAPPKLSRATGAVFAVSGSMSPVTARQVEAATAYARIPLDASRLVTQSGYAAQLLTQVVDALREQRNVLLCTQDAAGTAPETGEATRVAKATATLVAQIVQRMAAIAPLRRIGVAGGDTSSHVALGLGLWGLSYQTTLSPGVTLSRAHSEHPALDGLELMLKGGQMGDPDVLDRLVHGD